MHAKQQSASPINKILKTEQPLQPLQQPLQQQLQQPLQPLQQPLKPLQPLQQPLLDTSSIIIPKQLSLLNHSGEKVQLTQQTHYYNWNSAMKLIIKKMLQAKNINFNGVLLINNIDNRTNDNSLNIFEATETLRNILTNTNKFILISDKQLDLAKKQLGISWKDNLRTRSKEIAIARSLKAQYILFSTLIENIDALLLQMQLMLVQTGEIIWLSKITV